MAQKKKNKSSKKGGRKTSSPQAGKKSNRSPKGAGRKRGSSAKGSVKHSARPPRESEIYDDSVKTTASTTESSPVAVQINSLRDAIREQLVAILTESSPKLLKSNELSKLLGIPAEAPEYDIVREIIDELTDKNIIFKGPRRRFGRVVADASVEGRLKMIDSGRWELIPAGGTRPVLRFDREEISTAFEGDVVRARPLSVAGAGEIPWGEVIEVLERKWVETVGTLHRGRGLYVRPDSKRVHRTISISKQHANGARIGDKVVVALLDWDDPEEDPRGEVVRKIGRAGDMATEMASLVEQFDVPTSFPDEVIAESEQFGNAPTKADIKGRRDLRKETIFTIDPFDARDFDDAISYREHEDGDVTIGVHIADVSHYVREGSELDREAFERGTSIYLVTGVIPMLPEHISNNLCSLRPDEDRLAYTVEVRLSKNGAIRDYEIFKSVIRSKRRFTYEEALEILETGTGDLADELLGVHRIAKALRRNRRRKGSIDFDRTELKFRLDDDNKPVDVIPKRANDATRLIEDCMLLANRIVAEHVSTFKFLKGRKRGTDRNPFIYRIHDVPPKDKLTDLASFVKQFGYSIPTDNIRPKDLQRLVDEAKKKDQSELITEVTLRAMAKAVYSEHNIGHFGLAFDHYSHFTSPIRRYPDLIVHRMLDEYAEGMSSERLDEWVGRVGYIADQSSQRERVAVDAERKSIKVAEVEFLSSRVGDIFDATIISVLPFGMFAELSGLGIEGLIPTRKLEGYWNYDERKRELVQQGRRNRRYRIGDRLQVEVMRVDDVKQEIDLGIVRTKGNR